jgi:hypothetical protein
MHNLRIFALAAILVAAFSSTVMARPPRWRGGGAWGPRGDWGQLYDPRTVETVAGTIVSITVVKRKASEGLHLTMKSAKETLEVHLGPAWYLENQDTAVKPGDAIEVRGSRITYAGKPALIAAELRLGDEVLILRDADGTPRWAGWRRRAQP